MVAAQVALALPIVAADHGPLPLAAAAVAGGALLAAAWVRVRRRWLFEWIVLGARFRGRPHTLPAGASPADLLRLLTPDSAIDESGVITDNHGLTAVLELGDLSVLPDGHLTFPAPASLLPPETSDHPPTRVQLLLTGSPAPVAQIGGGPAATSYRQLSDGRHPAYGRAVLAMRVLRADGWSEADLRRSLTALVRRTVRSLEPLTAKPLDGGHTLRLIAELAHHDGSPIHETWECSVVGGLRQASLQLHHRSAPPADIVPRILALPTAATTVSVSAGPGSDAELTVRLASDTSAHLSAAAQALRRQATADGATVQRFDGDHLPALAATLPIGGVLPTYPAGRRRAAKGISAPVSQHPAGLVVGHTRNGEPAVVRLFRPVPTRVVVVGGSASARLVVFRAIAVGARVVVRTARPRMWEALATASDMVVIEPPSGDRPAQPRGYQTMPSAGNRPPRSGAERPTPPSGERPTPPASRPTPSGAQPAAPRPGNRPARPPGEPDTPLPGNRLAPPAGRPSPRGEPLVPPPGERPAPPPGPLHPLLIVHDAASPPDRVRQPAWSATLLVCDRATPADVEALTRADVVLLEQMRPDQAALVGAALGLGDGADWLTRIRDDMIGVAGQGGLRWVRMTPTPLEIELVRSLNS